MRFVEDDWESPTLGAWGLGWQVWLDGLEISQFTYFQQVGGIDCRPVSGELTYGLERIAMYLQDVDSIYDRRLRRQGVTLRRALQARRVGVVDVQLRGGRRRRRTSPRSTTTRSEAKRLLALRQGRDPIRRSSCLPAYDFVVKAAHQFNVLDARGAIGVTERQRFIGRVRGARAARSPRRTSRSARRSASPLLKGRRALRATAEARP